jgi:DNA-nicking Smr family endonuclease
MGKKKRKSSKTSTSTKPPVFTHKNPFEQQKEMLLNSVSNTPSPKIPEVVKKDADVDNGEDMWSRFYGDVTPLGQEDTVPIKPPKKPDSTLIIKDDQLIMEELSNIISGEIDFDLEMTSEYVFGIAPGVDRKLLHKLKKGEYSFQAHLDLHGYNWRNARETIIDFIDTAMREGKRCVLIIHGRGIHSKPGPIAILKKGLIALLTRGPLKKKILAFATARPVDGGPGSIYILLKKRQG